MQSDLYHTVSVADAFQTCATAGLDRAALLGRDQTLTYGAVQSRVLSLAGLLADQGIGAGDFVGLYATRSPEAIVGMLACLKAGAVFVPLDPGFAPEQLKFITSDGPMAAVLAKQDHMAEAAALFDGQAPVILDIDTSFTATKRVWPAITGNDPACVLYTSGTTGRPKGVLVPHRAITLMAFGQPELALHQTDVVLHASTIACDGALIETLVPLLVGAAVAVLESTTPEVQSVADTMIQHRVTVALWYAGLHNLMVTHRIDAFETVRLCEVGGDVMVPSVAQKLLTTWPSLQLFNGYGPTETCVHSLCHQVTLKDVRAGDLPIGRAMTGEDALILDEDLRPLQRGAVGQLAIGGAGVALGYFNRAAQTAASFIPDPREGQEGTLYLTGDLACQQPDGVFFFKGRADRQIKLAGRRVEMDGIEHILRAQPGVEDVVVELLPSQGQAAHLVAFVVASDPVTDRAEFTNVLREMTQDQIARDVFPRKVFVLDALPLTPAGKVDRKALCAQMDALPEAPTEAPTEALAEDISKTAVANPNDVLATISAIWQRVLGGDAPRASDTFFDLGGTSLLLMEAHAIMEKELGLRFAIAELFDVPRLGDLAAKLAKRAPGVAQTTKQSTTLSGDDDRAIAIIGMAARLPGGVTLQGFWDVIRDGTSVIEQFYRDEAEDGFDAATRASADYVPARAILKDVDQFDAKFFDMRPNPDYSPRSVGGCGMRVIQCCLWAKARASRSRYRVL